VRRALVVGAITTSVAVPVAIAQDSAGADDLDTVVVTGSRIKQANLESSSPVTQVTAADVATQGVTRIEDLINQLPQAFAAQNATVANGASGTATVNLRGLGSSRTLVLVDGRRMPYGGVTNSAADLNQIPSQLIERVEVLTGGASAVYGSDAVAGVVNFITKKDFEGVEVSGQYSFYQHNNNFGGPGAVKLRDVIAARAATNPAQFKLPESNVTDGFGREASILVGISTEDGRGNFTAYAGWMENDEVLQRDRDFSACALNAGPTVSFSCGGSSTASPARLTDFATYNFVANSPTWGNFNGATDQYNFGPTNHYLRPASRYNVGASGHYELNDKVDVYTQLMFTDYRSIAQIAPGGIFIGDTSTINCDNPYLPASRLAAIGCTPALVASGGSTAMYIGRRNTEGGGRQSAFSNTSFRAIVGVRGALSDSWDYDVSFQRSTVKTQQQTLNYFVIDRIESALDAIRLPSGQIVCRDPGARAAGCVPYNPFAPGGVTAEALDYLQAPGIQLGTIDQDVALATISGDTGFKLPTAEENVQVAFGAEYRRDKLVNETDSLLATAALSGTGGATIGITGSTTVKDLFAEARIPLVQGKALADSLVADVAYRFSDYGAIDTDTYKLGLEWSPISSVKLRGSVQRAVRAANIIELFTAQGFNLFDIDGDPCGAGISSNPAVAPGGVTATPAKCAATGVPAAFIGSSALDSPAGQYQFLQGGNPNLQPEESDTYTVGVIFQPEFAPGLVMSVDWFNIRVEGTVSTYGSENTLRACYNNNDAAACSRIKRNQIGQLWLGTGNVVDTNINIGAIETTGIDLNASYSGLSLGKAGDLNFSITGTYLQDLITEPGPGIDPYDCVGFFAGSCGTPNPEWRHQFRVGWETPWNLDLALTWRYYGEVEQFRTPQNRIDRVLGAQSYYDLAGTYSFSEKASVVIGVNNILDTDPDINGSVGTTGNGNTYPQTYDALGRYLFARVRVQF
jgi:outer membrane receptor protein involved in Fe transport